MDSVAIILFIALGVVTSLALQLVHDARERAFLMRLFWVAFGLRFLFTAIFYLTGLVDLLGGADDSGWAYMWKIARTWDGFGVPSLSSVYESEGLKTNPGWFYFGRYFYYLLNERSQTALAVVNCYINTLVVLVTYLTAREFTSARASGFVAWVAAFMPGFLIWSALTVKETWMILFQISTFYFLWKGTRARNPIFAIVCAALVGALMALTLGFRFYAVGSLGIGVLMTLISCWARWPKRAAAFGVVMIALFYFSLAALGIFRFDVAGMIDSRVEQLNTFRTNISDASLKGNNSGVTFDIDTSTPEGALLMLGVGSVYLLLSPFPWEINSLSQLAALPDILMWWWLVFKFILPGIRYNWRYNQALSISLASFILPLFLFYAFIFGNVGLAYRQRAQLMPFMLVFAAAGYEMRERKEREQQRLLSEERARRVGNSVRVAVAEQNGNSIATRANDVGTSVRVTVGS